jgi:hypothetical protein
MRYVSLIRRGVFELRHFNSEYLTLYSRPRENLKPSKYGLASPGFTFEKGIQVSDKEDELCTRLHCPTVGGFALFLSIGTHFFTFRFQPLLHLTLYLRLMPSVFLCSVSMFHVLLTHIWEINRVLVHVMEAIKD